MTFTVNGSTHDACDIEEREEGFVLRCSCGWQSPESGSAEAVGTAWDRHREAVGDH